MTAKKHNLLKIPQGTETFYFKEAYKHIQISHQVTSLFASWGYLPIQTPLFDFYDLYHPLLGKENRESIYRLMDREGELLMLRSDITLFLAKQISLVLKDQALPARICYSGPILRHEHEENLSRNEFYQTGIELIGVNGLKGDLEILYIFNKLIKTLQLDSAYIHLGSRALFNALFSGLSDDDREEIILLIKKRKWESLTALLTEEIRPLSVPVDEAVRCLSFLGSIGDFKAFHEKTSLSSCLKSAMDEIFEIASALEKLGMAETVRIDFSETGRQPYYTGFVFQVYSSGTEEAVASGGRYDKLLPKFGCKASAVGFSLMLRKIEPLISNPDRFFPPESVSVSWTDDPVKTLQEAEKKIDGGQPIILE